MTENNNSDYKDNDKILRWFKRTIYFDERLYSDSIALSFMSDCKRILDIGCGIGRFITNDPQRIEGIDSNKDSVEKCIKKGYKVIRADATKIPFEDKTFDGVHCSHLIEHLLPSDAHKLLSEMSRVLKDGGILVLRTPMLHSGFYDDFTHIKPYHPKAVLHYLNTGKECDQTTLNKINGRFELVKIKYRYAPLFQGIEDTPLRFIAGISNILYRFGIHSLKKTGYMLILRKIS